MLFVAMEEEALGNTFDFGALEDSKERCRERLTTALSSNDVKFCFIVHANSRDRGNPCTNCS